ncbi:hypothetical protein HGRIS_010427 [Hohenbuehelia grisea]|uniref:3-phytase n=1 Tax=Hohenbuehelia grisea TaxID=104357 RepID=A0ABR3IZ81_9AGAR
MLSLALVVFAFLAGATAVPTGDHDLARLNMLGYISPYHKAPIPFGVAKELPNDCKVDQVMLMARHGSRTPSFELPLIKAMTEQLARASDAIARAKLPKELVFLKKGYQTTLSEGTMTAAGRQQILEHGKFKQKYPHLKVDGLLAGDIPRVVESAELFAKAYFGDDWQTNPAASISKIAEDDVTVSWITSFLTCPKWGFETSDQDTAVWESIFLPSISRRLNKAIPGLGFTDKHALGALYACPYDFADTEKSPWCNVFSDKELADFA